MFDAFLHVLANNFDEFDFTKRFFTGMRVASVLAVHDLCDFQCVRNAIRVVGVDYYCHFHGIVLAGKEKF
jgi:hypothetical protein